MNAIPPQPVNEGESDRVTATESVTKIQSSKLWNWREERLTAIEILLKKMQERGTTMRETVIEELPFGKNGPGLTASGSGKLEDFGASEENLVNPPSIVVSPAEQKSSSDSALNIESQPSELLEQSLSEMLPTCEIIESESMSLLDESANHMLGLMRGLHANQPPAEIKSFDPERVNAAVACANTIYKIMRLKLDAIKVQRKLK